jgi:hypothetical protein
MMQIYQNTINKQFLFEKYEIITSTLRYVYLFPYCGRVLNTVAVPKHNPIIKSV